jgi:hypothetical protein
VNPCRRSGRNSPAAVVAAVTVTAVVFAAVAAAANTAYLPFLRAGEESSKRGNGDFKLGTERRG